MSLTESGRRAERDIPVKAEVIEIDGGKPFPSKRTPMDLIFDLKTWFCWELVGSRHTAPNGLWTDRSLG